MRRRRRRALRIGIFTFNKRSVTAKVGPVKVNTKGRISIKKGPFNISFKLPRLF